MRESAAGVFAVPRPNDGVRFDLDLPSRIEKSGHNNSGVRRADVAEELAVHLLDGADRVSAGQIDARAHHVGK